MKLRKPLTREHRVVCIAVNKIQKDLTESSFEGINDVLGKNICDATRITTKQGHILLIDVQCAIQRLYLTVGVLKCPKCSPN